MPASIHHSHFPAKKLPDRAARLRQLRHRGALTAPEYALCDLLVDFALCPQWRDPDVCWLLHLSKAQLSACRESLRSKGLLEFGPARQPGVVAYRLLQGKFQKLARSSQRRAKHLPPASPSRWIVFEHGQLAHRLQEDDLFAAERTLCGLPALDADWHPLPRLNSQPADHPCCCRCYRVQQTTHP